MNWAALKRRFRLFDETGLAPETISILRTLIASVAFGIVWANVTTGVALTSYLQELNVSDSLYGFIFAMPALANAFQFLCSYLLERTGKPRKMLLISGLIQRLIWIPIAMVPFIFPVDMAHLRLISVVVMALVSASMAPFMNVSFYTIATAVPMHIRGRYFATRSRVSTLVGLVVGLLVGVLLDVLPGFTAYAVVFTMAGLFGAFDALCYLRMREMPMRARGKRQGLIPMLLSVLRDKAYMRTVLILTAWLFVVQLTSPYFNMYARSVLNISNFNVILTGQVANNLLLILFVSRWGRAIDSYGNRPILLISTFLTALTPFMMTYISGPVMLAQIFFLNAWSGGIYCAVDLTIQNLFMNQARETNRSMYIAVYFLFTQLLGLALGSFVGGILLDGVFMRVDAANLTLLGMSFTRYNALFALGGLLRFIVVFALIRQLKEEGSARVEDVLAASRTTLIHRAHMLRAAWLRRRLRRQYARDLDQEDES